MLHVTNSTTQNRNIFYREPGTRQLRQLNVGRGRQERIGAPGWAPGDYKYVIEQLLAIGAVDAAELHGTKIDKFSGLSFRDDGVIGKDEIVLGHEHVKDAQNQRSVEQTVNAALAADRALNPNPGERVTESTTVEVLEQPAPGARPTGDEAKFSLTVATDGAPKIERRARRA